jgi:hypothetical protein
MAAGTLCCSPKIQTAPPLISIAKLSAAPARDSGLITDTFGRPWRERPDGFLHRHRRNEALRDDRGRRDPHGYTLQASLEAVADELACAAGLVCGKLNRTPACIIRGFRYNAALGRRSRTAAPCIARPVPLASRKNFVGVIWNEVPGELPGGNPILQNWNLSFSRLA